MVRSYFQSGSKLFLYVVISLSISMVYFERMYKCIALLFYKYTLLPDSVLKTKIEKHAKQVKFPLCKIYIVKGKLF